MFDKILDAILGSAESDPESSTADLGGYEQYLAGVSFPISKGDLLTAMAHNGASRAVLSKVDGIKADGFNTVGDLVSALVGGSTATRETVRGKVDDLSANLKDDLPKGNIL